MNWPTDRRFVAAATLLVTVSIVAPALAAEVETSSRTESAERHLSPDREPLRWSRDPGLLDTERGDRLEVHQVPGEELETVKLKNVLPPIRFASGVAEIPPDYVEKLAGILERMRHRRNVRVHFVGHADTQRLSESLARRFGDNAGLSRERAGEVAEHFKAALDLPPEAITYEWAGDTRPIASNETEAGRALNRRVEIEVWYDEPREALREQEVVVRDDIRRIKVCRMETVCKLRYLEGHERRARVRNLIAPLRYEDERVRIPESFVSQIMQALDHLRDKRNVTVRFIGYTDDASLSERDERIYGTHLAMSKARAHRVALEIQDALALPSAAVASDGRGAARPLASNGTSHGRALNRRVEVEFWYDDPLQELPDEPQPCPGEAGDEMRTRVYDPPWGALPTLELVGGRPVVPPGTVEMLHRALTEVADRDNPRLRFVGYTKNERLDRRTASVYGDDIGLSVARARRTMELLLQAPLLAGAASEHEGRGYVQSNDVVNAGFIQGEESFVRVQVVYDEPAPLDDWDGIDVTPITRELTPQSPYELNVMRITVDGEPIDDPGRSSADVQRCTDVALDGADIRFRFDNLESRRRLAVAAHPATVPVHPADGAPPVVRFRAYDNYAAFIAHAEVRIFDSAESLRDTPLAVVPVDESGTAEWRPDVRELEEPTRTLKYVLRVVDAKGRYDETEPRELWLVREAKAGADASTDDSTLLAAYGESDLARRGIRIDGGAVHVQGSGIPAGHAVWVAGRRVPVDAQGNFVAEELLPTGAHTVEVAVLDDDGNGNLYLRDLEFVGTDLFYVGMADVTLSANDDSGPLEQLQGADNDQPLDSDVDGRLAFYVDGKVRDRWYVTASADTREGPVEDLFSNFLDKSPDALFRRIDPDRHQPTYGDDSTVEETAPTQGKLFVKVRRGESHGVWGNFDVDYADNELARVDRGLYGANAHYGSRAVTSSGERRIVVDGFAAEPGTVASYDELRGTGGSLYFLRHQDILTGSERVRIEIRDKDSGVVTGVVNLRPDTDYDIDYLQGRVLLSEPLTSTADDGLLVRSGGLSGDEVYLVVRYEYTPGFDDLDATSVGGRAHVWVGDHVRLGLTANANEEGAVDSDLAAADVTVQMSAASWLKVQSGRSEGLVATSVRSDDGGFAFASPDTTGFADTRADATRVDLSVGIGDWFEGRDGRVTLYRQDVDAGYSAPGQTTLRDTERTGGTLRLPITDRVRVAAKGDRKVEYQGLETSTVELNVEVGVTERWNVRTGVRSDSREDNSPVVPLTQEQGDRTDAVVQVGYDPGARWRAYGFVQGTVSSDDTREDNGRVGAGGSYRLTERFRLDGEVSDGDLGFGARVGSKWLVTDRTDLYLNYALDNERTDGGLRVRRGNLVTGVKRRLADSSSVYVEQRRQDGGRLTGVTHAAGIRLVPQKRWNLGFNVELGTLYDAGTAAETDRRAAGARIGFDRERIRLTSAVEYRRDDIEQPDLTRVDRTTWLFRNEFRFHLNEDGRVVGKLNHAFSDSSQGEFFDGGYTEAVVGYAYRPVRHDRLQALAKLTYFANTPTTDQVGAQSVSAEFLQRSKIGAVDVSYDLTSRWTLGTKLAYRVGEVSLERQDPAWFDSTARLAVLRADWRFLERWEAVVEARSLDLPDVDETRTGGLAAVYWRMMKNLKVGAGYNFTDFSDDLTDLSYDHRGAFVNIVGSL